MKPNLLNMSVLDIFRMLNAEEPKRFDTAFYNAVVGYYPWPWKMLADMAVLYDLGRIG